MQTRIVRIPKGEQVSIAVQAGGDFELRVVKDPRNLDVVDIGDAHFRHNSAVFLPSGVEESDQTESAASSGIALLEVALRHLQLTKKDLLIAGHTDTVGSDSANVTLSEHRADGVRAALVGDRELFGTVADAPYIANKDKKLETLRNDMLQVCEWAASEFGLASTYKENGSDIFRTFRAFQEGYNELGFPDGPIPVDADWGPLTWKATFDLYQEKLAQRLLLTRQQLEAFRREIRIADRLLGGPKGRVGCGEFQPIANPGRDNSSSRTNRRVELLLFNPGEPVNAPCLSGPCAERECPLFEPVGDSRGTVVRAAWGEPLVIAGAVEEREVIATRPGIAPGDPVEFEVFLVLDGDPTPHRIGSAESVEVSDGLARGIFGEQSEDVLKKQPEDRPPRYSYFFVAKGIDFEIVSPRLHADLDNVII